jgi:hypothetical protein
MLFKHKLQCISKVLSTSLYSAVAATLDIGLFYYSLRRFKFY